MGKPWGQNCQETLDKWLKTGRVGNFGGNHLWNIYVDNFSIGWDILVSSDNTGVIYLTISSEFSSFPLLYRLYFGWNFYFFLFHCYFHTSTCELPDVQAGFRKGRGTRDQIANIHWIIEKAREFQINIYFCFIDCAKAFDYVEHNKLWKILKEMGIPEHLTCLLRNLYAGQEATV